MRLGSDVVVALEHNEVSERADDSTRRGRSMDESYTHRPGRHEELVNGAGQPECRPVTRQLSS